MSDQKPVAWEQNEPAQAVLRALEAGDASTITLQHSMPLVHVARQVWELRHWYGHNIVTKRLPNRVAVYHLVRPGAVAAPPPPVIEGCGKCGNVFEETRPTLSPSVRRGLCRVDGWQNYRIAAAA